MYRLRINNTTVIILILSTRYLLKNSNSNNYYLLQDFAMDSVLYITTEHRDKLLSMSVANHRKISKLSSPSSPSLQKYCIAMSYRTRVSHLIGTLLLDCKTKLYSESSQGCTQCL